MESMPRELAKSQWSIVFRYSTLKTGLPAAMKLFWYTCNYV